MTQMEANAVFFHSEFGISADFPDCSLHLIQYQNAGIMAPEMQRSARLSG
jgi:hypothetical protein